MCERIETMVESLSVELNILESKTLRGKVAEVIFRHFAKELSNKLRMFFVSLCSMEELSRLFRRPKYHEHDIELYRSLTSMVKEESESCFICMRRSKRLYLVPSSIGRVVKMCPRCHIWLRKLNLMVYVDKKYILTRDVFFFKDALRVLSKLPRDDRNFLNDIVSAYAPQNTPFDYVGIDRQGNKYLINVKSTLKERKTSPWSLLSKTEKAIYLERARSLGWIILIPIITFYDNWRVCIRFKILR